MTADAYCRCGHAIAWFTNGWRHVAHERWPDCPCMIAAPAEATAS